MTLPKDENLWVWVVVQDPEGNEQFLGQHDEKGGVSFIPVFGEKEDAQAALHGLARDEGLKYQPQAILYKELVNHAAASGFQLFVLNGQGQILEKIDPSS